MDATILLTILAVVMAVNTIALAVLLALIVRDQTGPLARSSRPMAAHPAASAPGASPGPDPLADAITAFLGRPEGLFRAGGSPTAGPPVGPAIEPMAGSMEPTPMEATRPTAFGRSSSGVLERSRPEVRWAPIRPTRYVPSGPDPTASFASDRPPFTSGEAPSIVGARRRPASRLEVRLVGREAAADVAVTGASARLGPVIGGLLRERTRSRDLVTAEGPGRCSVVLADTPLDGAAAVADRLTRSCDAWLAAESPALRLELALADVPGGVPAPDPDPIRDSGPERRRPVSWEARSQRS